MVKDRDYDDQRDEPTRAQNQDYDTPFSPPDDTGKKHQLPVDHPAGDDPVDAQEAYDEGSSDAAVDNPPGGEPGVGPRPKRLF